MPLRGKKPEEKTPRLKALMFGEEGVGKTMAAIQMPRPYIIDTESGCDHYGDIIEEKGGAVFQTTSMEDCIREVRSLATEEHGYLTLVIDPFTTLYDTELECGEKTVGDKFGRHYGYANKNSKRLFHLLSQLDMNVILTTHAKPEYGDDMKIIGRKPDGWKKLGYLFDLVFFLERLVEPKGVQRMALVVKTRIKEFPDRSRFMWSYKALSERYPHDLMMRPSRGIKLASEENVERFKAYYRQLNEEDLKRLGISRVITDLDEVSELPDERVVKGISLMENYLRVTAE